MVTMRPLRYTPWAAPFGWRQGLASFASSMPFCLDPADFRPMRYPGDRDAVDLEALDGDYRQAQDKLKQALARSR